MHAQSDLRGSLTPIGFRKAPRSTWTSGLFIFDRGGKEREMLETRENGATEATVHVRYEGRSVDVPFRDLDLGPNANDRAMREALARYLELPLRDLNGYVIE